MISTDVSWNQSQQVSIEMIKHHSSIEQTSEPANFELLELYYWDVESLNRFVQPNFNT